MSAATLTKMISTVPSARSTVPALSARQPLVDNERGEPGHLPAGFPSARISFFRLLDAGVADWWGE